MKDIEDEIPFEVPEGWSWCRLGNVCKKFVDGNHNPPKGIEYKTDYLMLSSRNINSNTIVDLENVRYLTKEMFEIENKRTQLASGDILFTSVGSLGRSCIFDGVSNFCFQRSVTVIDTNIFNNWVKYFFDSNYYQDYVIENATGTAQLGFYMQQMSDSFVVVPPLSEQQLIVAEIEKIFAQIDLLEQNKTDLQTAIKQAKSKILDLAIHGKLVSQDPNDESASVLLEKIRAEKEEKIAKGELKRDKNDSYIYKGSDNCHYEKFADGTEEEIEVPFDLPENWSWCKIKNIKNYIGDGDWIESKDQSTFGIRLLQTGNIGFGNFRDKKDTYHYISEETFNNLNCNEIFPGDILISRLPEPVGRACIIPVMPNRLITAVDCTILRINNRILLDYFFIYYTQSTKYLDLIKASCTGTTRLRISRGNLEEIMIPIPPLNEQNRIINKITEIFSILDKISFNLV